MLVTAILDDHDNAEFEAPSEGVLIYGSNTLVVYCLRNDGLEPGRTTVEMNEAV
jgi:hypothetical protein